MTIRLQILLAWDQLPLMIGTECSASV